MRQEKRNQALVCEAWQTYGNRCANCGERATTMHHIVPLSVGGRDVLSNMIPLCEECHGMVHDYDGKKRLNFSNMIREGQKKARERGVKIGQKRKEAPSNIDYIMQRLAKKEITNLEAAKLLGVGTTKYYVFKREWTKEHADEAHKIWNSAWKMKI